MGLEALHEIINDPDRIVTEHIDEKYTSFEHGHVKGSAEALVFPVSTEEVSAVLKYAHDNRIPVTPRGAGTNLTGSTVPDGGIVLDLSRMNHILNIDPETMTVLTEPGVLLEDLAAAVEEKGLFYPPDPGERKASIGGNISTNAGGMRAVRYGVTRDYVRGLEIVLADGTVTKVGSLNVKDASGLSLKNLIIGSEGTLAVITKCLLRLIAKPEKSVNVIVPFDSLGAAIDNVIDILHADVEPTAVEFVERRVAALGEDYTGIQFPFPDAAAYLLMTFDGSAEALEHNVGKTKKVVENGGAKGFLELSPEEAVDIWKVRGALVTSVEAVSEQIPVDVVVPINKSAEFIDFINRLSEKTGMDLIGFGHAGDGNVHVCVIRGNLDDAQWEKLSRENLWAIYNEAARLGGLTSGEHGLGVTKKDFFFHNTDPAAVNMMRSIKDALDSEHILNRKIGYNA